MEKASSVCLLFTESWREFSSVRYIKKHSVNQAVDVSSPGNTWPLIQKDALFSSVEELPRTSLPCFDGESFSLACSGAVEKQKLVYILNRDSQARLTISSPLEAHKANTITFHTVGVDVGFENPVFACLEVDYEVSLCSIGRKPWLSCLCVCVGSRQ